MREKPYYGSVSQKVLEDCEVERHRQTLCRRIDNLRSTWRQYGDNSPNWDKAWVDFTYATTTYFDGNEPRVMRPVLLEVIRHIEDMNDPDTYPKVIMDRLKDLQEQSTAWVNEDDELDQEQLMDEDGYTSDREESRSSISGMLTPHTLFAGIGTDHAAKDIRDARGSHEYDMDFVDKESAALKRTAAFVTPDRGKKEKKTLSLEAPVMKKRKTDGRGRAFIVWDLSTESSTNMVTPEGKAPGPQREIDLNSIPPLVFHN